MGYDLTGRNGTDWSTGSFSWDWMLLAGVGLPINCGPACTGGYSYEPDAKGYSPLSSDGYYVPAERARAMGHAALGLAATENYITEEWEKLSPEDRAMSEKHPHLFRKPVRKDFIDKAESFGEWALKSQGFWIR